MPSTRKRTSMSWFRNSSLSSEDIAFSSLQWDLKKFFKYVAAATLCPFSGPPATNTNSRLIMTLRSIFSHQSETRSPHSQPLASMATKPFIEMPKELTVLQFSQSSLSSMLNIKHLTFRLCKSDSHTWYSCFSLYSLQDTYIQRVHNRALYCTEWLPVASMSKHRANFGTFCAASKCDVAFLTSASCEPAVSLSQWAIWSFPTEGNSTMASIMLASPLFCSPLFCSVLCWSEAHLRKGHEKKATLRVLSFPHRTGTRSRRNLSR